MNIYGDNEEWEDDYAIDNVTYTKGQLARTLDEPLESNPYAKGTPAFAVWNDGWRIEDLRIRTTC